MNNKIRKISNLRIAAVMDVFTYDNFSLECDILNLDLYNFKKEIDSFKPDILFIESAWEGKNRQWAPKVRYKCSDELRELTDYARKNKIPSVFWNKEDPVHYGAFINAARLCDYVFTSDVDCISMYKADLPHDRVYFLPFACQPKIQNPIEKYKTRQPGFCFAGSAYIRFPERMEDMENIFDEILKNYSLTIYNRFYAYDYPRYKFPEKYDQYIKPNLSFNEIDLAYKGYEYAINLNSVKTSQSMSARRVYELMASGTPIVSNYSRALRNFFGDLLFMSDNGCEIIDRINNTDQLELNKIKLASLRKVLTQHSYEERLKYITKIATNIDIEDESPEAVCFTYVNTIEDIYIIINIWKNQKYRNKKLIIITNKELLISQHKFNDDDIHFVEYEIKKDYPIYKYLSDNSWIFWLDHRDWYGSYYLMDILLALKYSSYPVYGKGEYWSFEENDLLTNNRGQVYRLFSDFPLRRCGISKEILDESLTLGKFIELANTDFSYPGLALDGLNYCENGSRCIEIEKTLELDRNFDCGMELEDINKLFTSVKPANKVVWERPRNFIQNNLINLFESSNTKNIQLELVKDKFHIKINSGENPETPYSSPIRIDKYRVKNYLPIYIDTWHIDDFKIRFLDNKKKIISDEKTIKTLHNYSLNIPDNATYFQLGIVAMPNSVSILKSINLMHKHIDIGKFVTNNKYIIITSAYPAHDDLYKNAFLHTRLLSYKKYGIIVDLYIVDPGSPIHYREYQGIHVISGDLEYLKTILTSQEYNTIIVHFLYKPVWNIIKNFKNTDKIIWIHGSEIQPYYRRLFNYKNDEELSKAIKQSESRMAYWNEIFSNIDNKINFVFVSKYFASEVMKDYKITLPSQNHKIIYNPVNTEIFPFYRHPVEHRYNLVSIRTFFSNKYANDLVVKCILKLSERSDFDKFNILIAGDGVLFDETVEPLRQFANVKLDKRFYNQHEMGRLYKDYGVYLVPTRWDSQGVSRDEAMACGLVPVTNAVSAIPEFVNDQCAIIAPPEDWEAMAEGIGKLVDDPDLFFSMSKAAYENVISNRTTDIIIKEELALITGNSLLI